MFQNGKSAPSAIVLCNDLLWNVGVNANQAEVKETTWKQGES